MMPPSTCTTITGLRIWNPSWTTLKQQSPPFLDLLLLPWNRKLRFSRPRSYAEPLKEDSSSSTPAAHNNQFGYDPAQELFGLDLGLNPRDIASGARELRSWFGPNGLYIRELPCPSCRGRGYTPCTECGIDKSRIGCSQCNGKGMMSCRQCFGHCVIWEESVDERPWEKARSSSPVKVKDDELDNLDLKLESKKKSNRVYRSLSPELRLKISRSLKSLNEKTGLFSKRMKLIHRDPALHAQRVAAIKKAKGTPEARKRASETTLAYFRDPENRRKLSVSMKKTKFHCRNCGREGHRRNFCPELRKAIKHRCTICRKEGHNRKTCPQLRPPTPTQTTKQLYHCKTCRQPGHSSKTCPLKTRIPLEGAGKNNAVLLVLRGKVPGRPYECKVCRQLGHNSRACPQLIGHPSGSEGPEMCRRRIYQCRVCGQSGHSRRTCSSRMLVESRNSFPGNGILESEDGQSTLATIDVIDESTA